MGSHHAPDDPEPDRGPVPAVVLASFWLWLVVSGLGVVAGVDAARLGYWDLAAMLAGMLVAQLVAALRMLIGRRWARLTLLVFGLQQFVMGLRTYGYEGTGHPFLHGPIVLALLLAAWVLLIVPPAKRYFGDPVRAPRPARRTPRPVPWARRSALRARRAPPRHLRRGSEAAPADDDPV